ncbi:MAG: hypothetical protein JNK48_10890 [Bryobacterales bacterium]|nr:hypothetical protein [Bryobacterales bacterium]
MLRLVSMRPYPILLLGIVNALLWRELLLSGQWYAFGLIGICAVATGWYTKENPWFAVIALCAAPLDALPYPGPHWQCSGGLPRPLPQGLTKRYRCERHYSTEYETPSTR